MPYHLWYGMGFQRDVPWDGISLGGPIGRYILGMPRPIGPILFHSMMTRMMGQIPI